MKKKLLTISVILGFALSTSAMIMGLTYQKVSDKDCNKCSITNGGASRKCGICGGFLTGGKGVLIEDEWIQAEFTCNICGHSSTWKYKNK